MKKIIISLSIVAVATAMAIGGTIAYFSDTETSTGNIFTVGKLDLKIDSKCSYNGNVEEFCTWNEKDLDTGDLFFNFNDVKPGDFGEDTVGLHVINNDAWACVTLGPLVNNDNGCNDPEDDVDTTCGNPGEGEGELGDNIYFDIWADFDCENDFDEGIDVLLTSGPANGDPLNGITWAIADANGNIFDSAGGPLIGDEVYCLGIAWNVPEEVDNIIQSDSLSGNLSFYTVQSRHNDNFVCSDLTGNDVDGECILDADCDDGNFCNGVEICNTQHVCESPGNPCPGQNVGPNCNDSCNEANDNCTANDQDGTLCTGGSCQSGTCAPDVLAVSFACSSNTQCDDGNPCTNDTCSNGACQYSVNTTFASCDDGDACTTLDSCQSNGVCQGGPVTITNSDFDSCTIESCNQIDGLTVTYMPDGVACSDLDCMLAPGGCGTCLNGNCTTNQPPACITSADCDDSNACTNDLCNGAQCSHTTVTCNDGNPLTVDSCIPETGCVHIPCTNYYYDYDGDGYGTNVSSCLLAGSGYYTATQAGDCNDGNALANPGIAEICGDFVDNDCDGNIDEGTCFTIPVSALTPIGGCNSDDQCDDSNSLTLDSCANGSCINFQPITPTYSVPGICTMNIQCDDGNSLTIDECSNGTCVNYMPIQFPMVSTVRVCFPWVGCVNFF